tara:strand:+ start:701 stop:1456 length:756 start_codon:yes stop_codon:yes gene_type:complete
MGETEIMTTYFKTNTNKVVTKIKRRPVKVPSREICFVYGEKYNFIDDRTHEKNRNFYYESTIHNLDDFYPYFSENKWHDMLPIIFDTEVVIRPTYLLDDDISNSYIKECTNLVPYKTDLIDTLIHKLNIFDIKKQSRRYVERTGRPKYFQTIQDAYNTDKNIVWGHLDNIIGEQRDIEQKLIDKNIPYQHFCLDGQSYSIFDLDVSVSNDLTSGNFEHNTQYHILEGYAKEYVTVRGLTDMKLSGRIYDKI